MKRVVFYGAVGGVLIALLKLIEYQHFVRTFPFEVYGGLIAAIFSAVGIFLGVKLARQRSGAPNETTSAPAPPAAFVADPAKLAELGITPREHEVLALIAQGLSNREIGEKLFVSENTIKTHSSRLFEKLGVGRRVQAVQKAREIGLLA